MIMNKLSKIVAAILVVVALPTIAQENNLGEYVYPFGSRTFISLDSNGKSISVSQYSFASESFDNYLIEEVYVGLGIMSAKSIYRYYVEGNAVISDVQLRQNALTGSTRYEGKITIFALPYNDKPYTWSEFDRGDKISGKSEYVYVKIRNVQRKAVKITKDITYSVDNVPHKHQEKSYWVEGFGRIVTYYSTDGSEEYVSSRTDNDALFWGFELSTQGM